MSERRVKVSDKEWAVSEIRAHPERGTKARVARTLGVSQTAVGDWLRVALHHDGTKPLPSCAAPECEDTARTRGYCRLHYGRLWKRGAINPQPAVGRLHGLWRGGKHSHAGYVRMLVLKDDPLFDDATPIGGGRYIFEHRLVMSRHLGRPLYVDEEVHHRNGEKSDNRLENLELWSGSQPRGQRVEDKVDWAIEMLQRYAPERLK